MARKVKIELTPTQLWDVVTCLSHCYDRGLGYGQNTWEIDNLYAANRRRLMVRLKKVAKELTSPS